MTGEGSPSPAGHHHHSAVASPPWDAVKVELEDGTELELLDHGAVVIAAITSCTNTSNPSVMIGAGLLARNAVERGLVRRPWVKTSLAPGSKVVTDYLERAGLIEPLEQLGFSLVGYGCTTCIGNSGPLPEPISRAIEENDLAVCSVLSGNRNFEGRIHPEVKMNYLASPPLVVAYALAGRMDVDLPTEPLQDGVHLSELWPSQQEVNEEIERAIESDMFRREYAEVFKGDEAWRALPVPEGERYAWDPDSTYVKRPPYFEGMSADLPGLVRADRGRPRARAARRLGHHRPHLARRRDQEGLAGRPLPARARRGAARVQLLRLAARQPRGDDARHLRQRADQEQGRPRHRARDADSPTAQRASTRGKYRAEPRGRVP